MPTPPVLIQGLVGRKKPQANLDGARDGIPLRAGRYGEEYNLQMVTKNHGLADEGSYFVASNPTHGTGIIGIAAMTGIPTPGAGTDVNPYLIAYNSAQPQDGTRVYLDALQLLTTAAGTNGTNLNFAVQLDTFANRVKQGATVGGTSITPVCPNMDDGTQSMCKVWAGANVILGSGGSAGAGFGVRLLPHRQFKTVITAAGDVYCISFGAAEQAVGALLQSSALVQQTFNYPPIVIGPQQVALIYLWASSQTVGASFEFDLNWWER